MDTFSSALASFIEASPWLAPEHEPEVTALRFIADTLDNDPPSNPAPLIAQWGLALRSLRRLAPTGDDEPDPLEQALKDAQSNG